MLPTACVSTRAHTIGFVGLGAMGAPMAHNLLTKSRTWLKPPSKVLVHDVHAPAVGAFIDAHAQNGVQVESVSSPAELAQEAATIVSMVPSSAHVEALYLGPDGILTGLENVRKGASDVRTLCLDSTTLSPGVSRRVAQEVCRGHPAWQMLDTPVSGGTLGASKGTLTFMVGAPSQAIVDEATPTLQTMGARVVWCGPQGTGLSAKIANNLLLGISMAGTCEAMALGLAHGLDKKVLASILNSSTGRCWASAVNNPVPGALDTHTPADDGYAGGFAARLLAKDLGLALDAGGETEVHMPVTRAVSALYHRLMRVDEGAYSGKDFSVLFAALQETKADLVESGQPEEDA